MLEMVQQKHKNAIHNDKCFMNFKILPDVDVDERKPLELFSM